MAGTVLVTIALLWFATAVAPSANFVVTTRTALLRDRATGVRTAFGIAYGTTVWGLAGFFGIHALFTPTPWLHLALKTWPQRLSHHAWHRRRRKQRHEDHPHRCLPSVLDATGEALAA